MKIIVIKLVPTAFPATIPPVAAVNLFLSYVTTDDDDGATTTDNAGW